MALEKQVVEEDAHVISGTFLVNSIPTFVLFDSCAIHSFVSRKHVTTLGLGEFDTVKDDVVIPSGKSITCIQLFREVTVMVGEVDFLTNLFEYPLENFEVILGMDWLQKNQAKIDCHQKKVSLKGPKGARVSYRGFMIKPKVKLINVTTLKLCLGRGCPMLLCHVRDTRMEGPRASYIPIVGEFEDVFSEELPGLSPNIAVEFNVELKSGTGPISKSSCRMGPKELE
ncbi:uncharacterized protein LOC141601072 [Silene latifolia]|uniref:uncharacterized protein LOC141601072 n=1 Tax=Silene latifolia TaxID=37657 RepID=UPI003D7847BF